MKVFLAAAIVLAMGTSALAQSPYISASVGLDVSRFSGVDTPEQQLTPGGEAIAMSLRGGTRIGERWGLELGFTRPAETDSESSFGYPIPVDLATLSRVSDISSIVRIIDTPALPLTFPVFQLSTRLERRDSTLEVAGWASQAIGRVEVVYLGGVAFNRTVEELTYEFPRRFALLPAPSSIRSTTYGVAPLFGIDARVTLTNHLRLTTGTRLQSVGGGTSGVSGWIVRPSVGAMWQF